MAGRNKYRQGEEVTGIDATARTLYEQLHTWGKEGIVFIHKHLKDVLLLLLLAAVKLPPATHTRLWTINIAGLLNHLEHNMSLTWFPHPSVVFCYTSTIKTSETNS